MFVPTVIFYLPEKDKSAHLIGKFDKPTIQKHEQQFAKGQLATFPMKTKSLQIQIQDLDCPNIQPEVIADEGEKDLEDEILKEILKEDEERRKKREKEEGSSRKGKKKDSKKKGKKTNKDEL